jgi:hypothetical protein
MPERPREFALPAEAAVDATHDAAGIDEDKGGHGLAGFAGLAEGGDGCFTIVGNHKYEAWVTAEFGFDLLDFFYTKGCWYGDHEAERESVAVESFCNAACGLNGLVDSIASIPGVAVGLIFGCLLARYPDQ